MTIETDRATRMEDTTPSPQEELIEQITAIFGSAYTQAGKTKLIAADLAERVLTIAEKAVVENNQHTQESIQDQIGKFDAEIKSKKPLSIIRLLTFHYRRVLSDTPPR